MKGRTDAVPLEMREHVVYRFYDAAGGLLYVGMTSDLPGRLRSHASGKPWWGDVVEISTKTYPTQEAAAAAELAAIIGERPKYNREGAAASLDDLVGAVKAHVRARNLAAARMLAWRSLAAIGYLPAAVGVVATVAWSWWAATAGASWIGLDAPMLIGASVGLAVGAWMVGQLRGWTTFAALMALPVVGQLSAGGMLDGIPEQVRAGLWAIGHTALMVILGLVLVDIAKHARRQAASMEASS